MEGPGVSAVDTDDHAGMIPRAVTQVFEMATTLQEKGWQVEFCSMFISIFH